MALRMDDFTQKENSIKLSLQTVDYRLSKLEDLCIHTSELTTQIRNYLAKNSRKISVSSTGSHSHLDSEVESMIDPNEIGLYEDLTMRTDGSDKSLNANETIRNIPSPLLIHSRRPIKDDFLRKYTDFSMQPSPRVSPRRSSERQMKRNSIPKISLTPDNEAPLHLRRHVPENLTVNVDKANTVTHRSTKPVAKDDKDQDGLLQIVTSHDLEVMNVNQNASLYSTASLKMSPKLTTSSMSDVPRVDVEHTEVPAPEIQTNDDRPIAQPPTSPEKLFVHNSSIFTYPMSSSYSTSSVLPILTSLNTAEYTTITDEIDTSCMIDRSPPGSPTSGGQFFPDGFFDPDKKQKSYNKEAMDKEYKKLKHAEETEHRKMEKVIRHRLRQISLDETDSISDIAKLVVTELNMTEEENSGHEEENDELHSSTESVAEMEKLNITITVGGSSSDLESKN